MSKGEKTQIVLDADVVIHFAKGERLSQLPEVEIEKYVCETIL